MEGKTLDKMLPDTFSNPIGKGKTSEISDFLDCFLPLMVDELGIEVEKVKKFSFKYDLDGETCFFNIFKSPLNYEYFSYGIPFTEETVCVFYLFNYYSYEQLAYSILSFFKEIILKNNLKKVAGIRGYYDIKFSKHEFIPSEKDYVIRENENKQYYHFKDTLACRKTVMEFKNAMDKIVNDLERLNGILVEKAVQSENSESFYLAIVYRNKKIKRNLKISVRSHPIHTKSQMCFYLRNFEDLDALRECLVRTVKEFNWYNYKFDLDTYFDVYPDKIITKESGEDLSEYTKEQLEFINGSKGNHTYYDKICGYLPSVNSLQNNFNF